MNRSVTRAECGYDGRRLYSTEPRYREQPCAACTATATARVQVEQVAKAIRAAGVHQLYLVIRTQAPQSQVYLALLESGTRGLAFDLGTGDDFRSPAEDFKRTLVALGKTLSSATR